jgi:hypothetical protein
VNTRVLSTFAHEAAGAAGTRHSPRPLLGREINAQPGRIAPRDLYACLEIVIARSEATKQSILSLRREMDCFAALAMTVPGRIRATRWLAMTVLQLAI